MAAPKNYIKENKWIYPIVFAGWTVVVFLEEIYQHNNSPRNALLSGLIIASLCTIISIVTDAIRTGTGKQDKQTLN